MEKTIISVVLCMLAVLMLCLMIKVVKGPRFTDRILAVNAINTMLTASIDWGAIFKAVCSAQRPISSSSA